MSETASPGGALRAVVAVPCPRLPVTERAALALLLVVVFALRVVLAGRLGLTFDEAYYFSWARHPAASYLDHPPLIAWLLAPVTSWAPPDPLRARLPVLLLAIPFSLAMYAACRDTWGARVGWAAVLVVNSVPAVSHAFLTLAPDAPLLTAWMLGVHALQRALRHNRVRAWLALGVATGLCLLAKYMAVLFALSVVIVLLIGDWRWLRRRGPWLALGVAAVMGAPVLAWNAQRDWASFRFQLLMGPRHGDELHGLLSLLDFALGQFGVVTPALALGLGLALRARRRRRTTAFWTFTLVPLGFFALMAWRHPQEANWASCAWLTAVPLVVVHAPACGRATAILGILFHALAALYLQLPFLPAHLDVTARGEGWSAVAATVEHCARAHGMQPIVVLGARRYETAQLDFHLGDRLPVRPAHAHPRYAYLPPVRAPEALLVLRPDDDAGALLRDVGAITPPRPCAEVTRRRATGEALETFRVLRLRLAPVTP